MASAAETCGDNPVDIIKEWNLKCVSFDKENKLKYHKDDKKEKCIDTCDLTGVHKLFQLKVSSKKNFLSKHRTENIICLSYGKKSTFYLKTENKKEAEEWYTALRTFFLTKQGFYEDEKNKELINPLLFRHSDFGTSNPAQKRAHVVSTISTASNISAPGRVEDQFENEENENEEKRENYQEDSSSISSSSSGNATSDSSRRESSTSSSSCASRRNSVVNVPVYENVFARNTPVENSDCSEDNPYENFSPARLNPGKLNNRPGSLPIPAVVPPLQKRLPTEQDEKEVGVPVQESGICQDEHHPLEPRLLQQGLRHLSKSVEILNGPTDDETYEVPMLRPTTPKPKKKFDFPPRMARQRTCPPGLMRASGMLYKKNIRQLKKEISGRDNVEVAIPLEHLDPKSIALCPLDGYVWIAGWTNSAKYLANIFCVGDLLISINGTPCKEKELADQILKSSCENRGPGKDLNFTISRVPGATIVTLKKREGEDHFGLILKDVHEVVEIVGMIQGSEASQAGIPPKTMGMDSKHHNWVITEINLTPVDIFSNADNVKKKLSDQEEVILLLQSADKIGALKRVMRQTFKDLSKYGPQNADNPKS